MLGERPVPELTDVKSTDTVLPTVWPTNWIIWQRIPVSSLSSYVKRGSVDMPVFFSDISLSPAPRVEPSDFFLFCFVFFSLCLLSSRFFNSRGTSYPWLYSGTESVSVHCSSSGFLSPTHSNFLFAVLSCSESALFLLLNFSNFSNKPSFSFCSLFSFSSITFVLFLSVSTAFSSVTSLAC